MDDARELAAQARHPALEPIATMLSHYTGHGIHQAGPVLPNHRHHEGTLHKRVLAGERQTARSVVIRQGQRAALPAPRSEMHGTAQTSENSVPSAGRG